ncbi:hypothetical protein AB0J82_15515 [Asanoa sp. NPDC049518]|uniref:hypothetical protein n=1 Tax=unclassified Asanoa TaxID=2685164 RepID=UPI003417624F
MDAGACSPSRRVAVVEGLVTPERRMIMVLGGVGDWDFLPDFGDDRLCYSGMDVLYLMSVSQWSHDAAVALEAWTGEPPVDPDAEVAETTTMRLTGGRLYLTMMGVPTAADELPLDGAGSYHVRVTASGRAELLRLQAEVSPPPWLSGVERFRVSVWPDFRN